MGLIQQAKELIEQITVNSDDFAVAITLTSPTGTTATIKGLHTKHHLGIDTDGNMVNTKKAHVSFSEKYLTDVSYPIRNAAGEVDLKKHKVSVKDSTGTAKNYMIQSWYPDETVGLIVCILEDFG